MRALPAARGRARGALEHLARGGGAKPRNPRHFDRFEGGRKRVSDTSTHKNSGSEEHNHYFMHYFGVKTVSETLFSPPLMKAGDGTRQPERGAELPGVRDRLRLHRGVTGASFSVLGISWGT